MSKESYRSVADQILRAMERPGPAYYVLLATCFGLVVAAALAWHHQAVNGVGVSLLNNPVGWGSYITNFVFWVGIAHSGTAISAILFLLRTRWRTSLFRTAEAMTLFAVMTAGMFPLIHLGRLWRFYYLVPYPNQRDLWPNFKSPLIWDFVAILTYLTISAMFLYLGMLPDLAVVRERAKSRLRRFVYGALSLGWRGSDREWSSYLIAYVLVAGLATPLVISVHSVVSWDFAVSEVPGWHSTIFAPYFVAGAIHSGFAMVLTLIIPLRRIFHVENLITLRQLEQIAKAVLLTGLIMGYSYLTEFFIAWYSGNAFELEVFVYRATGDYAALFWVMIVCNSLVPLAFFWKRVRTTIWSLFVLSILINVGMYAERFIIIVTSLGRDYLPHQWNTVTPTWVDVTILAGSFGWFFMWLLLFIKLMPWVPIAEIREVLPKPGRRAPTEEGS